MNQPRAIKPPLGTIKWLEGSALDAFVLQRLHGWKTRQIEEGIWQTQAVVHPPESPINGLWMAPPAISREIGLAWFYVVEYYRVRNFFVGLTTQRLPANVEPGGMTTEDLVGWRCRLAHPHGVLVDAHALIHQPALALCRAAMKESEANVDADK